MSTSYNPRSIVDYSIRKQRATKTCKNPDPVSLKEFIKLWKISTAEDYEDMSMYLSEGQTTPADPQRLQRLLPRIHRRCAEIERTKAKLRDLKEGLEGLYEEVKEVGFEKQKGSKQWIATQRRKRRAMKTPYGFE